MKLVDQMLDELFAPSEEQIKIVFNNRIDKLGFEGVNVANVSVEFGGDVLVEFLDDDGDEMDVLFTLDEDEGAIAIILDSTQDLTDDEDDDIDFVDLDGLDPKIMDYGSDQKGIDLTELNWFNASALQAILNAGDFLDDDESLDDLGQIPKTKLAEAIDERTTTVVRGGKRVKIALVRRRRRKRLTSKQKQAIRKGVRTRKKKKGQIKRKLKKSLKIRKRLGLKKNKNKSVKVKGTKS